MYIYFFLWSTQSCVWHLFMRMFYNTKVNTFFWIPNSCINWDISKFKPPFLLAYKKNSNTYFMSLYKFWLCWPNCKARCFCKSLLINSKTLKESWTLAAARRSPFSSLIGLKMINKILIVHTYVWRSSERGQGVNVSYFKQSTQVPILYKEICTF